MIVTFVTYHLAATTTLDVISKIFQATVPKALGLAGLLRKNYWLSEDGERAGGIYVWESREVADKIYTPEWAALMEGMYGSPPMIEHVPSPVMADNRDGTISIAA